MTTRERQIKAELEEALRQVKQLFGTAATNKDLMTAAARLVKVEQALEGPYYNLREGTVALRMILQASASLMRRTNEMPSKNGDTVAWCPKLYGTTQFEHGGSTVLMHDREDRRENLVHVAWLNLNGLVEDWN